MQAIEDEKMRKAITEMPAAPAVPWADKFPDAKPEYLALVSRLLTFQPGDRFSATEGLKDPMLKGLPPITYKNIRRGRFTFVDENLSLEKV